MQYEFLNSNISLGFRPKNNLINLIELRKGRFILKTWEDGWILYYLRQGNFEPTPITEKQPFGHNSVFEEMTNYEREHSLKGWY